MVLKNIFGEARDEGRIGRNQFLAIPASVFMPSSPAVDDMLYDNSGLKFKVANILFVGAAVILPHNAQIDRCIVFGDATAQADLWQLERVSLITGTPNAVCVDYVNTEKVASQSYNIVDNENYFYRIFLALPTINGKIFSARIAYTI